MRTTQSFIKRALVTAAVVLIAIAAVVTVRTVGLRLVPVAAVALIAVAAVVAVRTVRFRLEPVAVPPVSPVAVDVEAAAAHLADAISIPTVSFDDPEAADRAAFERFVAFLEASYPALHRKLARERVGPGALLYRWDGRDPSLPPVVLMAHYDVVPVQAGSEAGWTQPPFGGARADGFVWGRGALDDKAIVIALCEAVERLARADEVPDRTLYLAFGDDEEVGGRDGAARIARLLGNRGVAPELVLDEGGMVVQPGMVPGVNRPVAQIGIAEKGYLSLELAVAVTGGHSSAPPPHTAVGILASAIAALEREQMPRALRGAARQMLLATGPAQALQSRVALANLWLTGPMVTRVVSGTAEGNALVRTTTAATMFEGSPKDNVLPSRARAVVNFRILTGDTVEGVKAHVRRVIDDDRVTISACGPLPFEASPITDTSSWSYRTLRRTVLEIFPDALTVPSLLVSGTDSRYFLPYAANVLRFTPIPIGAGDVGRFHGTNERIREADLGRAVAFYLRLIRNTTGAAARGDAPAG